MTETSTELQPVSTGERLAAVLGILAGAFILAVCLDMALGGKLSGRLSRECGGCGDDGGS